MRGLGGDGQVKALEVEIRTARRVVMAAGMSCNCDDCGPASSSDWSARALRPRPFQQWHLRHRMLLPHWPPSEIRHRSVCRRGAVGGFASGGGSGNLKPQHAAAAAAVDATVRLGELEVELAALLAEVASGKAGAAALT